MEEGSRIRHGSSHTLETQLRMVGGEKGGGDLGARLVYKFRDTYKKWAPSGVEFVREENVRRVGNSRGAHSHSLPFRGEKARKTNKVTLDLPILRAECIRKRCETVNKEGLETCCVILGI